MTFHIEQNPNLLDFDLFSRLNDACFPHEPVSLHEFQTYFSGSFWVVYDHQEPISFAVMSHGKDRAHIRRIGVHPHYRRKGLGKSLMDAILRKANDMGTPRIDLLVQQDNVAAIQLYRKYGFQITGESIQFSASITPLEAKNYVAVPIDSYRGQEYAVQNWAGSHAPPHQWVLIFLRGESPVGFTRFSPGFPGCSPFELFQGAPLVKIQALVSTLGPYALPNKTTIKITTSNPTAISLFKSSDTLENYSLYQMVKTTNTNSS